MQTLTVEVAVEIEKMGLQSPVAARTERGVPTDVRNSGTLVSLAARTVVPSHPDRVNPVGDQRCEPGADIRGREAELLPAMVTFDHASSDRVRAPEQPCRK